MLSVLLFAAILIVLILVHEYGHFIAAKFFKIRVDEFGIGFPPKLIGVKRGETEYTINALPIGGFVRIWGEDAADISPEDPDRMRSFAMKPRWQQAIVLSAGVVFNVLLAWVIFTGGFMFGMPSAITEEERDTAHDIRLLVTEVLPDSPAFEAGMVAGDEIIGLTSAGDSFLGELTPEDVSTFVSENPNQPLSFVVSRSGKEHTLTVTPQTNIIADNPDRAAAGFVMTLAGIITLPPHLAVIEGAKMTYEMTKSVAIGLGAFFTQLVTFEADFNQVSGPVGIVGLVGDAQALGMAYLFTFTAFISLNLAVINILPFPALDGGRLLFVIIESIIRRPISPRFAKQANAIGFLILIGLIIAVTVSDVAKLL